MTARRSRPMPCAGIAALWILATPLLRAQAIEATQVQSATSARQAHSIDLPTALRLAGANNLDVQIARAQMAQAEARHEQAVEQFFPWIAPGVTYRRHDDRLQDTQGNILDVHKQSYAPGAAIAAHVAIGDALYDSLATHQLVGAARADLEVRLEQAVLAAAEEYFDLTRAHAGVGVAREALRVSEDYENQLHRAVQIGIAFRGEELRVRVQTEHNRQILRQAEEQERLASARLAEILHLDATLELVPQEEELAPLSLVDANAPLSTFVAEALKHRPELASAKALVEAAEAARKGAVFGPLYPSIGVQAFLGGLGGGKNGSLGNFGPSEDYAAIVAWRVGPGGLFDSGRIRSSESRLSVARLSADKTRDEVVAQVVEAVARVGSLTEQLSGAERSLAAAQETLRLTGERKQFEVGAVLENIQSQQELTRARNDYLQVVAELDKAQYRLRAAVGSLPVPSAAAGPPSR